MSETETNPIEDLVNQITDGELNKAENSFNGLNEDDIVDEVVEDETETDLDEAETDSEEDIDISDEEIEEFLDNSEDETE